MSQYGEQMFIIIRSHFGSRAISCSNVHGFFPVHERFWFCLVQVSTTQFCCFPPVLMARASDGTDVPVSPLPAFSSNMGSPNGSLPELDATGYRATTMEEKINEIYLRLQLFLQNTSRIENCVQMLSQTAAQTTKITSMEQIVGSLALPLWKQVQLLALAAPSMTHLPRWRCLQQWNRTSAQSYKKYQCKIETNATSVSSGSGSATSWNLLGRSDGSTATGSLGSHGPGSSDDICNTRRRLDTFSSTEDEQSRSAVLLWFPCGHYHKGITK